MKRIIIACSVLERVAVAISALQYNHDVVVCTDGEQAIEALRSAKPDILFIEMLLPRYDAFEVIDLMRSLYTTDVRVIMTQSISSDNGPTRDWNYPVDAYLISPYHPYQALLSIEQFLYRSVSRPDM